MYFQVMPFIPPHTHMFHLSVPHTSPCWGLPCAGTQCLLPQGVDEMGMEGSDCQGAGFGGPETAALQFGRPQHGSWWGISEIYVTQQSTPPPGKSAGTCRLPNPLLAARGLPKADQRPGLKAPSMSSQQSLDKATCLSFPLMSTLLQQDQIYMDEEHLQKGGCSPGLIKAGQSLGFSCHMSNPQAGDKA